MLTENAPNPSDLFSALCPAETDSAPPSLNLASDEQAALLEALLADNRDAALILTSKSGDLFDSQAIYLNPAYSRLTGDSLQTAADQIPWFLTREAAGPEMRARVRAALAEGLPVGREAVGGCINGRLLQVFLAITPVSSSPSSSASWLVTLRDLADSDKIDAELRKLSSRARCLIWHALVEDRAGRLIWNFRMPDAPTIPQWLPIAVEEGQAFSDAFLNARLPEEAARLNQTSSAAIRAGRNDYSQEFQCRMADGERRWLSENVHLEPLGAGRWHAVGVCVDITERRQAEETLRESENRFQLFMDNSPAVTFIKDEQGRYVFVNARYEQRFGITRKELWGKTDFDFLPEGAASQVRANDAHVLARNEPVELRETVPTPDGKSSFWHVYKFPFIDRTGRRLLAGMAVDVTAQQQAEQALRESRGKYQLLTESMDDIVSLHDPEGRFLYVSPSILKLTGYTVEEAVGQNPYDYFHPLDRARVLEQADRQLLDGNTSQIEWRCLCKNGSYVWIETKSTCVYDEQGQLFRLVCNSRDITERKLAENERRRAQAVLAEERNLLRTLIDSLPDYIYVKDTEGRFLLSNKAHQAFLETTSNEQAVGKTVFDFFAPEMALRLTAEDDLVIRSGQSLLDEEEQVFAQGGRPRWVSTTKVPLRDGQGEIAGLVGISRDITERILSEHRLEESKQRYKSLFDYNTDAVYSFDLQGRFLTANDACERISGYSVDALMQMSFRDLLVPEDQERGEQTFAYAMTGEPQNYEIAISHKDGHRIDLEVSKVPIVIRGEIVGVCGTAKDITEQKRAAQALRDSEERFRSLVQNATDVITILEADGTLRYQSPAGERLLGHAAEELIGNSLFDLIHADDAPRVLRYFDQILTRPGVNPPIEFRVRHRDGQWRHLESVPSNRLDDPAMQAIVVNSRDITERKQAEDALHETNSTLEALIQASPLAIMVINPDSIVHLWNPAAERIFGWSAAETLGRPHPIIPLGQQDEHTALRDYVFQGQAFAGVEKRRQRKDGSLIDVSISCAPLYDAQGRIHSQLAIIGDITERKQAEEQGRRSAEEMSLLVGKAHCLLWRADVIDTPDQGLQWHVRFADEAAAEQQFRPSGSAPGLDFAGAWYLSRLEEDRAPSDAKAARAIRAGEDYNQEFRIRRQDGAVLWMKEDVSVETVAPGQWRLVGVTTDIDEQKTWEMERERLLLEALERADCDPLTGLPNHRAFHKRLAEEAERALADQTPLAIAVMDLDNFKFFNDAYGHSVGDDVLRQLSQALRACCRPGDTLARFGGDEFALLMPRTNAEDAVRLADRLVGSLAGVGYRPSEYDVVVPMSLSVGLATFPDDGPGRLEALAVADNRLMNVKSGGTGAGALTERVRAHLSSSTANFSMLNALVTAVDTKDRYTRRHSEDVMAYSLEIAQELGLDDKTQHHVLVAALLHDVGKVGVPNSILRKPGRLTEEEFRAVQQHPMMGSIIVAAVPGFEDALDAIRHHHERWDGNGYPFGLRGEETPLLARLMAVADAYSAMTTDRPYRKGLDPARALDILHEGAGTQWDPACVEAFLRAREKMDALFDF